jgi:hypothetical protein
MNKKNSLKTLIRRGCKVRLYLKDYQALFFDLTQPNYRVIERVMIDKAWVLLVM